MSNARSPRDVCSTTIGTRGLIVLALFRFLGSNPSGESRVLWRPSGGASLATANGCLFRSAGVRRKAAQAALGARLRVPLRGGAAALFRLLAGVCVGGVGLGGSSGRSR